MRQRESGAPRSGRPPPEVAAAVLSGPEAPTVGSSSHGKEQARQLAEAVAWGRIAIGVTAWSPRPCRYAPGSAVTSPGSPGPSSWPAPSGPADPRPRGRRDPRAAPRRPRPGLDGGVGPRRRRRRTRHASVLRQAPEVGAVAGALLGRRRRRLRPDRRPGGRLNRPGPKPQPPLVLLEGGVDRQRRGHHQAAQRFLQRAVDLHDVVVGGGEHRLGQALPGLRDPGDLGVGVVADREVPGPPVLGVDRADRCAAGLEGEADLAEHVLLERPGRSPGRCRPG